MSNDIPSTKDKLPPHAEHGLFPWRASERVQRCQRGEVFTATYRAVVAHSLISRVSADVAPAGSKCVKGALIRPAQISLRR
jgi:hypothetical protein